MVGHGVTLDKFHFFLATQLSDDLSNFATEAAIKYLFTVLRDDHYIRMAFPPVEFPSGLSSGGSVAGTA
jgi:hypothetical protein